jgi:hypothetical protein
MAFLAKHYPLVADGESQAADEEHRSISEPLGNVLQQHRRFVTVRWSFPPVQCR